MKFLWTNFRSLLKRFRAASTLNIAGLAVALAVAIVVAVQVRWDFTYDRGYANAERIFTIRRYMHADGVLLGASTWQWPIEIKAAIPDVEGYTLLNRMGNMTMDRPIEGGEREQHSVMHYGARGDFLRMFSPEIIAGGDVPAALAHIERTWKKFTYEEFSYKFLDDEMDGLYRHESNMAHLIGLFGLVTVIIAMMGVYGLIFFNSRYRTREIAIRKVNGAEVGEVVRMLNRAMFIQLGVAFAVATPVALVIVRRWLEGFAYRAEMPWWLFAAAGVAVAAVSIATAATRPQPQIPSNRLNRSNPYKTTIYATY